VNDTMDAIMNIASEILNSVVIGAYSLDQELSALLKETREQLAAFKNFERSNCNANVS